MAAARLRRGVVAAIPQCSRPILFSNMFPQKLAGLIKIMCVTCTSRDFSRMSGLKLAKKYDQNSAKSLASVGGNAPAV